MPRPRLNNPICPHGHDRKVTGAQSDGSCCICRRNKNKQYYRKNPGLKNRENMKYHRLREYGLSQDAYESLIKRQDSKCAICKQAPNKSLAVDHDHKTGRVRGLLCTKCNLLLGLANDNCELLSNSLDYLKKNYE